MKRAFDYVQKCITMEKGLYRAMRQAQDEYERKPIFVDFPNNSAMVG